MFGIITELASEFFADESGATAIEYGVVLLFIASGLVIVIDSIGTSLDAFFQSVSEGF